MLVNLTLLQLFSIPPLSLYFSNMSAIHRTSGYVLSYQHILGPEFPNGSPTVCMSRDSQPPLSLHLLIHTRREIQRGPTPHSPVPPPFPQTHLTCLFQSSAAMNRISREYIISSSSMEKWHAVFKKRKAEANTNRVGKMRKKAKETKMKARRMGGRKKRA